ncbi:tRNA cyclic N6-threonylcarbamoyladenosine(37) synthase TcdA [Endozoicomonas sp. SM1973]|uniref:tRNA threonylcarbamoyladenosine dehydratase n=1 Tax=Spartinivicinus marinus TaxID=2994442 RepID=A0A853I323_9GAMM|nr:tRNA cyclic N6-threonylcarbamoyladenosine(37) synthase TcdA [Spartinivicinus marinus]MCX4027003.1 tRNA cyclic N6-threonylcarbamoyladenosine(37) synthase TcdA [Spartinivicinus marinus]NYZ66999.1 tRNA cyclic N6-threonylcarbamoyladenosine(37) synthase TcdA [Spartinivicinus marinus]
MAEAEFEQRFGGLRRLYGSDAIEAFKKSHVAVVGIGGVGSWAAEALARSAIGTITLIDLDDICITNTNRQIHALQNTVGLPKVEVMAERIKAINPHSKVNIIDDFITTDTLADYLTDDIDCVIDAIDSVRSKTAMIAYCKRHKIPIVVTGGAGGQIDPTLITTGDLSRTYNDPLLAKVRNLLRREYRFSTNPKRRFSVECVYSTEQLTYPKPDGSVCQQKSVMEGGVRLDCSGGFGAATMVTASFGFAATACALRKIIKAN